MLLMEEAERIAREEHGSNKIAVISGLLFILWLNSSIYTNAGLNAGLNAAPISCPQYHALRYPDYNCLVLWAVWDSIHRAQISYSLFVRGVVNIKSVLVVVINT